MRTVNGIKIAFVPNEEYFTSMDSRSLYGTAQETKADVVFLLGKDKTEADVSDAELRVFLNNIRNAIKPLHKE